MEYKSKVFGVTNVEIMRYLAKDPYVYILIFQELFHDLRKSQPK